MSKKSIWTLLSVMLLFASMAFSATAIEPPPDRDIFTVAIIGDRTGGQPEGLEHLERAIYEINQLNPDFVMHMGDMVQGYTRDQDLWLREHEEFMSYMKKLNVPYFLTAGNHDVFSPIWDTEDRTYEKLYKKHFGPVRYSFDYKNSHFIVMYTDDAMTSVPVVSDEQIEWLKADLKEANKENVFIFLHKPVWRYHVHNWDDVHQVIKNFPVKAVIAGHFHTYQKDMNLDGIQYYVMGPAGGEHHNESGHELYGYFHHYNILRVEDDKFTMAVVKLGNVESDDYILAEDCIKIRNTAIVSARETGIKGSLWQPINADVEGELEIFIHNPLDVDMPVTVKMTPERSTWSMEPPMLGFVLAGKSNTTAKIKLSSLGVSADDTVPPQLEFEYTYTDTYGRKVPAIARRRVFLRDKREVPGANESIQLDGVNAEPIWHQVPPFNNYTWKYSVYERPDAPPKMSLVADDEYLYFYVEAMDDNYSYLPNNQSRGFLSDAILFSTLPGSGRRDIAIFPFSEEGSALIGAVDERGRIRPADMSPISGVEYFTRIDQQAGYYYCEGRMPLSVLFDSESVMGKEIPFNAGVLDNDHEAFVYVRSWTYDADPQYWGILKFPEN